jgi:hypothetical protein
LRAAARRAQQNVDQQNALSPILELAKRTKLFAKDERNVQSIISRYQRDMTMMVDEEKQLLRRQISSWVKELNALIEE